MPDLHKKELLAAQKSIISHSVDAHGGFFLPVPPHQLFPSGGFLTFTLIRALEQSGGPLFLPIFLQTRRLME
jgi:hypothetical protein